jgi:hypothetical protein
MFVAPDEYLSPPLLEKILIWSDPPKAIEILEVIDLCNQKGLDSGVVNAALRASYREACEEEGTTHEEVAKMATWRHL